MNQDIDDPTGEPNEIFKNDQPPSAFRAMKETLRSPIGDLTQPLDDVKWEVLGE